MCDTGIWGTGMHDSGSSSAVQAYIWHRDRQVDAVHVGRRMCYDMLRRHRREKMGRWWAANLREVKHTMQDFLDWWDAARAKFTRRGAIP